MDRNDLMGKLAQYRRDNGMIDTRALIADYDDAGVDPMMALFGPIGNARYDELRDLWEAGHQHNTALAKSGSTGTYDEVLSRANAATNWLLPALMVLAGLAGFAGTLVSFVGAAMVAAL